MADVRKAAELVRVHDQAIEWRESFEKGIGAKKARFIEFSQISIQTQLDGMGDGWGWDGELIVSRSVAIEMMRWLERHAVAELEKMGVTP